MTVEVGTVAVTDTTPSSVPNNTEVSLADDTAAAKTLNRTSRPTDLTDDPLDITPKTVEPSGNEAQLDEQQTGEETSEENPEEETKQEEEEQSEEEKVKKAREEVGNHLDGILNEKTGVGLDGVIEAITTLLGWYNDILSLEGQPQTSSPQTPAAAPNFQRSQGRTPLPAQTSYDFRKSEILAMDNATYSKRAQDITNAYLRGRVLNDVE